MDPSIKTAVGLLINAAESAELTAVVLYSLKADFYIYFFRLMQRINKQTRQLTNAELMSEHFWNKCLNSGAQAQGQD